MSERTWVHDAVPGETLLDVRGLNAWYGPVQVLFDVNLHVARGEVVGITGINGAGKSSLLKGIMGLMPRRSGQVVFAGRDLLALSLPATARLGLGYVPEERRIFTDLSVAENLEVARQAPRCWPDGTPAPHWTPERLWQVFPHLHSLRGRSAGEMSGGEQQMLTVARTMMGQPLLVLLDEPSEGMAPMVVEQMAEMVRTLKANGVGVLLAEQNEVFVHGVCDRTYRVNQGRISPAGVAEWRVKPAG